MTAALTILLLLTAALACHQEPLPSTPPAEQSRLVKALFECLQTRPDIKEGFIEGARDTGILTDMTARVVDNWEDFRASMTRAFRQHPTLARTLVPMAPLMEAKCAAG